MKVLKQFYKVALFVWLIVFMTTSFVMMDINPSNWPIVARGICAFLCVFLTVVALIATFDDY